MSQPDKTQNTEVLDVVRDETALDLAAFRKFVFRVGDPDDDATIGEAAEAAAKRIDELEAQQEFLAQELGTARGDDE